MTKIDEDDEYMETQERTEDDDIDKWIPNHLRKYIQAYREEYCYTFIYHYKLLASVMVEGFLPFAVENVIMPKLHYERCVVSLPEAMHVTKNSKKRSKKFRFTTNQCFDRVVEGCWKKWGSDCWLYPELVKLWKQIMDAGEVYSIVDTPSRTVQNAPKAPVRFYSIEVWNEETGELAGGELGYTVGSIYTSITGFNTENNAGSVQLSSLGRLLCTLGFTLWDLGMGMDYKKSLGSHLMKRKAFVAQVHDLRIRHGHLRLPITDAKGFNCRDLIDQSLSIETLFAGEK